MPIYAYPCALRTRADVLRKMSDPVTTLAPRAAPRLLKQVTAAGFQLKGSGWYVTDFRDDTPAAPSRARPAAANRPPPGRQQPLAD